MNLTRGDLLPGCLDPTNQTLPRTNTGGLLQAHVLGCDEIAVYLYDDVYTNNLPFNHPPAGRKQQRTEEPPVYG